MEETSTLDAELDALFNPESKTAAPAAGAATEQKTQDDGKQPDPAASPDPVAKEEEDPVLKALAEIEEPKEEKSAETNLTAEQTEILDAIPDKKTFEAASNMIQGYMNLADALTTGKYTDVEGMFSKWNKDAWEGFLDHIYETKVNKEGGWVQRFIDEQEHGPANKEVKSLQTRLAALESQLTEKKAGEEKQTEAQREQVNLQAYSAKVVELFDKVKFNAADRRWVTQDINARIAGDKKAYAAVRSGDLKAVPAIFKAACKEYLTRDKQITQGTDEKIEAQAKKVPPMQTGGAGGGLGEGIPENIKDVKKGDEDKWQDRALDKLFGTLGVGKKK